MCHSIYTQILQAIVVHIVINRGGGIFPVKFSCYLSNFRALTRVYMELKTDPFFSSDMPV